MTDRHHNSNVPNSDLIRRYPPCSLCGEGLVPTTSYNLQGELICIKCLLALGPERAQILLKVNGLDPVQVADAVKFIRGLLTYNQKMRLRETIRGGGRNWWVKLPEFGEYICRKLKENNCTWEREVLDEVWDRLVNEAVEE